jgi:hypothetical protein
MSTWKKIRIGIIVIAAATAFFLPVELHEEPSMNWTELVILFVFVPIGLLFIIGIQAVNPFSAKEWKKPDWDMNFLNFTDPVPFFHFGAYIMLVQGAVMLCRLPFENAQFHPESFMSLLMGVSVLLGVQIIMLVFRSKYKRSA